MIKSTVGFFKSLALNGRDILFTLASIVGLLFVTNFAAAISAKFGVDASDIKDFVFAIAKFGAVALCGVGYLAHITFRQSLGSHDTSEFMKTWKEDLTAKERLEWFFKVSIAGLIAASIIFGIGV